MAKQIVKDNDGHYIEMSDREYRTHRWRNSGWYVLFFIIILFFINECVSGTEESENTENDSIISTK